jgi:RimJ/RimL family protein N-acetyltransferase
MRAILETDRLILREWEPEDAEALFAMVGDPEVMRFMENGQPWASIERVRDWIARLNESYRTRGFSRWAVVEKESGRVVGSCGFAPLAWSGEIDFGYLLARDVWGRGYATEIGRATLRHGFEHFGFAEVTASVVPEHASSRRVLEKLGFVYKGLEVQPGDEDESVIYVASNPNGDKTAS